jgi:negative regulator of sigma E activity
MIYADEELSAFLDNELPEEKTLALKSDLAEDNALRIRLGELQLANDAVRNAYSSIDDRPMPQSILAMLSERAPNAAAVSVAPQAARPWLKPAAPLWTVPLAACVALLAGLVLGPVVLSQSTPPNAIQLAGLVPENHPLYTALQSQPSATTAAFQNVAMTPVLSFRSVDDAFCREFQWRAQDAAVRGVACRTDGQWRILVTVLEPVHPTATGFSTAASASPIEIDNFVNRTIKGDPLNPEAEMAFLDR